MIDLRKSSILWMAFVILFLGWGCNDEDDIVDAIEPPVEPPVATEEIEIQGYIWEGMNGYYLWQPNVPNLADDRFTGLDDPEYLQFLASEPDPTDFFESLIYNRQTVDIWSWIVDDYIELENSFAGISKSNGVDFGLARISNSSNIVGYVRYILPNSDASDKDIRRGDAFTHVNGIQLTVGNYRDLLFSGDDTYTLDLADIIDGTITPTDRSVELTKFEYTENPVLIAKTFEEGGRKIGYLLYNGFTRTFDSELNDAFLQFKNEGVTDLILDFRYNPGGSVGTAISLGSMVTGQFEGEVFSREQWNPKYQAWLEANFPERLVNNFRDRLFSSGERINSLNLNSVHIIVTGSSASASELIISALQPYIDVTLVGSQTSGKYTASVTLYDSSDYGREGANPNHRYAMQPIVLESVNSLGQNDKDGYEPDIEVFEDLSNMGILGDRNETLLKAALNDIVGGAAKFEGLKYSDFETFTHSKLFTPTADNMYVDKPELGRSSGSTQEEVK